MIVPGSSHAAVQTRKTAIPCRSCAWRYPSVEQDISLGVACEWVAVNSNNACAGWGQFVAESILDHRSMSLLDGESFWPNTSRIDVSVAREQLVAFPCLTTDVCVCAACGQFVADCV